MPPAPVIDVDETDLDAMNEATRAAEENQVINEVSGHVLKARWQSS